MKEPTVGPDEPLTPGGQPHPYDANDPLATAPTVWSGWVAPATDDGTHSRRVSRRHPLRWLAFNWLTAGVLLAIAAWVARQASSGSDAYRLGRGIGLVVAAVLLAAGARWLVVRLRGARTDGRVLRSAWIPLGAALFAIVSAFGMLGARAPVDPTVGLRISAPFSLVEATPALQTEIQRAVGGAGYRSVSVREVRDDGITVGWLVAGDGNFSSDDLDEAVRGFQDGSGLVPTREQVAGHDIALAASAETAIAIWLEPPLMMTVVAGDPESARVLVEAVLAAP